jgi:glycosyltransferase involved in cell wall biosynthesis
MTIYTLTYNEELMLPFFVAHYRRNFPNCRIVVYDNESTDNTVKIAGKLGCEVRVNQTNGKLDDLKYIEIKNNCWKETKGWVMVVDVDELLHVTPKDLNCTAITVTGYNMVSLNGEPLKDITHGVRSIDYDKFCCFDASQITDVNYGMGCHQANPKGNVQMSFKSHIMAHYKYIDPEYMVARFKRNAESMSTANLKHGWGGHYLAKETEIRNEFAVAQKQAIKVL